MDAVAETLIVPSFGRASWCQSDALDMGMMIEIIRTQRDGWNIAAHDPDDGYLYFTFDGVEVYRVLHGGLVDVDDDTYEANILCCTVRCSGLASETFRYVNADE